MNEDKTPHKFLTVADLNTFNEKVNQDILNSTDHTKKEKAPEESASYDPNKFQSFISQPSEIDDDLLLQLADIIDKKTHYNTEDFSNTHTVGPNTSDRILSSIAVAYIMEGELPIAVSTLLDPTIENFKGIIPCDYYEMKSGKKLEDRIQQEFFAIKPEYGDLGLTKELKKLLLSEAENIFIINPVSDKETSQRLAKNGYKLISAFETEWESEPVELWIN